MVLGARTAPSRDARPLRTLVRALLVLAAGLLLGACQVQVHVDTTVADDGSGTVRVGVGLDDPALARAGDLSAQLRVDDLRAAGWAVTGPQREDDGYTWVWAEKGFADPAAAAAVLDEVNGPDGAFGGWTVSRSSSPLATSWKVQGAVDLSAGMATFTDQALAQLLGGDPFGGAIQRLEQQEGRPISDMVDVEVTVNVPGRTTTYHPTLGDAQPTAVDVSSSRRGVLVTVVVVVLIVAVVVAVAVVLRRRATRHRRSVYR